MTALISGDADIGFMGSESSVYVYQEGSEDYAVNFAQLTQRAGNFLVSRTPDPDFSWEQLRGKTVLGGRENGMPEMIFEFILKKNGLDPKTDLSIDKSIDFGLTAAAFSGNDADYTVEFEPHATALEQDQKGYVVASLGVDSGYVPYTAYCAKKSFLSEQPSFQKRQKTSCKTASQKAAGTAGRRTGLSPLRLLSAFLFSVFSAVYFPCFFASRKSFNSAFGISVMNIWPGAWVMTIGGFAFSTAACGVTPQAQNTGISPSLISTGSP